MKQAMVMPEPERTDEALTRATIAHYDAHAAAYQTGTRTIDAAAWVETFLDALPADRRLRLLDLGCGPGRDLALFAERGHYATGLDGAREMAALARQAARVAVLEQDLIKLDLEPSHYDGVFANASLFHVPRSQLTRVLRDLRTALVPAGVLFLRVPLGGDREERAPANVRTGRYACFLRSGSWQEHLHDAGFEPQNAPQTCANQWMEALFRRPAADHLSPPRPLR